MSKDTSRGARRLKNFLIDPHYQLKYILYFTSLAVAIWGGAFAWLVFNVDSFFTWLTKSESANPDLLLQIHQLSDSIIWISLGTLFLFLILSSLLAILVTHRVAGPMVAINKVIEDMTDGNYNSTRPLRKYDELESIAENLKALQDKLKKV